MNLKTLEVIDPTAAKPPSDMTDAEWQRYFEQLRDLVSPSSLKRISPVSRGSYHAAGLEFEPEYLYDTQWQCYRRYINSVLSTLRSGGRDYAYFIYQIADLLQYEHDRLCATWLKDAGAFRLSLKSLNK